LWNHLLLNMPNKVFLKLGAGGLQTGWPQVSAVLKKNGCTIAQIQGSLPENLQLKNLYSLWQFGYAASYERSFSLRGQHPEIEVEDVGIEGFSETTFQETYDQLQQCIWTWLESPSFSNINNQIRLRFQPDDEIAIVIETDDEFIYRLPWHFWSILQDFCKAEVAFSMRTCEYPTVLANRSKPRILAVLGDSTNIDLDADTEFIQQLHAEVVFLDQPSPVEFSLQLDDPQGWDLLFFAGHGSDQGTGTIQLSPTESLTLTELSHALESAIARGLQLAIFNCCSGLKLGSGLATLNMPTVIVMREAVPNYIAQSFLRDFLKSFAQGNPLLTAVRHARQQLKILERDFPCATWLPVVFWNPLMPMPSCKILQFRGMAKVWRVVAATALLVTAGMWVVRGQGYLEPIELMTYDLAMNSRWKKEVPDPRILVVGINEQDFSKLQQNNPLTDQTVAQAIENLHRYQPRAIGVDIYRDQPQGTGEKELQAAIQNKEVISVCKMPGGNRLEFPVVQAPSGVKPQNLGFTNFATDPDKVLRRQLLGMAMKDPTCATDHALSTRLALQYLGVPEADEAPNGNMLVGKYELPILAGVVGGYRSSDSQENLGGYQVFLNYRHSVQIAKQVSLTEVLNNQIDSTAIRDKIVLIGYVAKSTGDDSRTAYRMEGDEMAGVLIHAHMVSNILSHVLDGRRFITVWPDLGEQGWILWWCSIGGIVGGRFRGYHSWIIGIVSLGFLGVGYLCWFNLVMVWVPLVPAALGLVMTGAVVTGWREVNHKRF
jgi:CHASE2 domain-containing sensor protein